MNRILLTIILISLSTHAVAHEVNSKATYLGNEGVLVVRGETKILFDAFFTNSYGQYTLVPDDIVEDMLSAQAPFDGIKAIFVSHVHGDHFSPEPAIEYLRAHPQVQLYAPDQILESFLESGVAENDPILQRVNSYSMAPDDEPMEMLFDGLVIEAAAIPHSGGEATADISNFAWRVTLDGATTTIHLGDAGPVEADFERQRSFFEKRKSHVSFVPYWLFLNEEGIAIVNNYIAADQNIGVHIPAARIGSGDELREQLGTDAFTDPGESRLIRNQNLGK